jgi:hypothetical protein
MNLRIPKSFNIKMHDYYDGSFVAVMDGQAIAFFAGRSQCKTFCKRLQQAMARLGPSDSVDPSAFAAAISGWLNAAVGTVGTNNGFFPSLGLAS